MTNPFSNWSIADAEMHNQRVANRMRQRAAEGFPMIGASDDLERKGVKREADLHAQIFDECRRRGWIAFHGSMAERTHRTAGEPDFQILCDGGKLLLIECKTRTGKLSIEQQAIIAHAAKLGHTIHVVRSFSEFLDLTTTCPSPIKPENT
jgi:hypothetical protein